MLLLYMLYIVVMYTVPAPYYPYLRVSSRNYHLQRLNFWAASCQGTEEFTTIHQNLDDHLPFLAFRVPAHLPNSRHLFTTV